MLAHLLQGSPLVGILFQHPAAISEREGDRGKERDIYIRICFPEEVLNVFGEVFGKRKAPVHAAKSAHFWTLVERVIAG